MESFSVAAFAEVGGIRRPGPRLRLLLTMGS